MVGSTLDPSEVVRANVALPFTTAGLARSFELSEAGCWVVEIDPRLTCPSGLPVEPEQPIADWEAGLRAGEPVHVAMLDPVLGVRELVESRGGRAAGLRVEEGRLLVCVAEPAPDLRQRLAHPRLWHVCRTHPLTGLVEGPGAFRQAEESLLLAVGRQGLSGPALESVALIPDDGMPSLLLRLGEADLGILLGSEAEAMREGGSDTMRFERLPRWDRTYFLWFDDTLRWTHDPRFRAWLTGQIDREAVVEVVLDGAGEPVRRLIGAGSSVPGAERPVESVPSRPFAPPTRPRLELRFDGTDPWARSLAARIKAVLELNGVALRLQPQDGDPLIEGPENGEALVLRSHRPHVDDPVLGLLESLQGLPAVPERTLHALRVAARQARPDLRLRAARAAEDELIGDGRLAPLVRIHAWLAVHRELQEVRTGGPGVLLLEDAWWRR